MAFSYPSPVAPPVSTFVPYVPRAYKPKPKPTPKAKSMARTTAEHSRTGIDCKDGEELLQVDDDLAVLDWNASQSTHHEAADAPNSAGYVGEFRGASELENPERDQFGGQSLDEGQSDLAMIRFLSGTSRDLPLVVESDAAEEYYSAPGIEPNNVSDSQEGGQPTSIGNEEHIAVQHSDLDTDEVRTSSTEEIESARPNSPLAQNEPLFGNIEVTDRPSATRKRTHSEALDIMPELELEDTHSKKRRKPVELLAETLGRIQMPTPRSTPLQVPSGGDFHLRASTEPSPGPLDHGSKRDGAETPRSSASDLHTGDDGSDSAHSRSTGEALLPSSREPVSRSKGIPSEHYIGPDSERLGNNREGSGGERGESHKESNPDDGLFPRTSAKASRRRERSNRPLEEKRHSPSETTLGRRGSSTMPRASQQITPSQAQQPYWSIIDEGFRSRSPQNSSQGTKAGDEPNTNHRHSVDMSYQITDLTLCAVPNGSSIVTVVVRYRDSKCPLDPAVLGPRFLGRNSKVIRMTQLSLDSWMLLGYRYDNDASDPCTGISLKADWMSESHSDAANHETNSLDDDWDEKSEMGEKGMETYGQSTRRPWLESDEVLLLSLKDKQGMEWKEICKRFPGRTPGAVQVRYYTLRKKDQ